MPSSSWVSSQDGCDPGQPGPRVHVSRGWPSPLPRSSAFSAALNLQCVTGHIFLPDITDFMVS